MADDRIKLQVEDRSEYGKGASRRARREGKIPAVIYGHGEDPQHILMPGHDTFLAVRNPNALLTLVNAGNEQLALPKDIQRDPLTDDINHVDLITVRKGEKVVVDVWVEVVGEVAHGATYILELAAVPVEADATNLPESVTVNVEGRNPGEHVYASDVELPEGATVILEEDISICTINEIAEQDLGEEPEVEEEAAPAAEEKASEGDDE